MESRSRQPGSRQRLSPKLAALVANGLTGPLRLRAYFLTARQTGPRGSRDTMARLAARVGVTAQTIWHITRGQPVSPALALKIAQETGIDAATFPIGRGTFPPTLLQQLLTQAPPLLRQQYEDGILRLIGGSPSRPKKGM